MPSPCSSVVLQILAYQVEKAKALPNFDDGNTCYEDGHLHSFNYETVKYGELPFLHSLRDAGIAFDSSWGEGTEYTSGTKSCRFTPEGDCIEKELYDNCINPPIDMLIKFIDQPDNLRKYILDHQERFAVLPLDVQQIVNGKLYLTHKLIGSTPITKED